MIFLLIEPDPQTHPPKTTRLPGEKNQQNLRVKLTHLAHCFRVSLTLATAWDISKIPREEFSWRKNCLV